MARTAQASPEVPPVIEKPEGLTDDRAAHESMLNTMKRIFAEMPRVKVRVHNDSDVFVQINGYSFLIKPGKTVEVPEQVAEVLEDAGYI